MPRSPRLRENASPTVAALLVVGLAGAAAAVVAPRSLLAQGPVRLGLDLLLGAGLYGLLRLLLPLGGPDEADRLVPALAPAVVTPVVVRRVARSQDALPAGHLVGTVWFEASLVAAALLTWGALRGRGRSAGDVPLAVGLVGLVAPATLVAVHLASVTPRLENLVVVLGATALAGLLALLQRRVGPALPGRLSLLGRWAPATVAGSQLLDGLVTAFAVATPLGLLPPFFVEANPVSGLLLEGIGAAFAPLKWVVGLATGLVLEATLADGEESPRVALRVAVYLLVLRFSLGPGVFSALQVLR